MSKQFHISPRKALYGAQHFTFHIDASQAEIQKSSLGDSYNVNCELINANWSDGGTT